MSCADCRYRSREFCTLFDDIILSFANSCFMDSTNSRIVRDGDSND